MNSLFDNAVQSIQLGVEDYQSNDHGGRLRQSGIFMRGSFCSQRRFLSVLRPTRTRRRFLPPTTSLCWTEPEACSSLPLPAGQ